VQITDTKLPQIKTQLHYELMINWSIFHNQLKDTFITYNKAKSAKLSYVRKH